MNKINVKLLEVFGIKVFESEKISKSYSNNTQEDCLMIPVLDETNNFEYIIQQGTKLIETKEEIKLLVFDIKAKKENDEIFIEYMIDEASENVLNKETLEYKEEVKIEELSDLLNKLRAFRLASNYCHSHMLESVDLDEEDYISEPKKYKVKHYSNTEYYQRNIFEFLFLSLKYKSKMFFDIFEKENLTYQLNRTVAYDNSFIFVNIYNCTFHNTLGFEKIYNINKDLILKNIKDEVLEIGNDGKINKVLEIPAYVLKYINENNYSAMLPYIQNITVNNGNDYRHLLEFLDHSSVLVPSNKRAEVYTEFVKEISLIYKATDIYDLKDLLNFLLRTSYFGKRASRISNLDDMTKQLIFDFPLEEAKLLKDYINMGNSYNLKTKKYPDLITDHDILSKNISLLLEDDDTKFIASVKEYKSMVDTFKDKELTLIVPETIKDMVNEGNELHHCVASYTKNVEDKESKIFFLRQKDKEEESYFTVELDASNKVNHVRGKFQEIPDSKITNKLEKWAKDYQ